MLSLAITDVFWRLVMARGPIRSPQPPRRRASLFYDFDVNAARAVPISSFASSTSVGNPPSIKPCRRRRLHNHVLATAAAVFGLADDEHRGVRFCLPLQLSGCPRDGQVWLSTSITISMVAGGLVVSIPATDLLEFYISWPPVKAQVTHASSAN